MYRELIEHTEDINHLLARYGVKFGIYKNGEFKEQLFPFDAIPRVITKQEFEVLDQGLRQRVDALNLFLNDIYGKKQIIKDGIIPEDFVYSSKGYLPQCDGIVLENSQVHVKINKKGEVTSFVLKESGREFAADALNCFHFYKDVPRMFDAWDIDSNYREQELEGVRLLREYLDYAENGSIALERAVSVSQFEQFDSDFELEVCDFLRSKGFSVDTQVGCSGFRIDLGLKRPDSSDYVLAVECDGATYHSSQNARDRDRLRQEILERMG